MSLTLLPARWVGRLVRRERRRSAELAVLNRQLAEQRGAAEVAAVAAERARIAREVHDSVAHSVSVMTLQLGGLRRQLSEVLRDRPQEVDVLLGLERLGRQTVDELRGLVGLLRQDDGEPAPAAVPSLARADEVIDDVRAAGLAVELTVQGKPYPLPRAVDQSALRILQEALTNALRHAPHSRTTVDLAYGSDAVTLTVASSGVGPAPDPGGGHGLLNMRERARMFGGSFQVDRSGDAFTVRARLPVPASTTIPRPSTAPA